MKIEKLNKNIFIDHFILIVDLLNKFCMYSVILHKTCNSGVKLIHFNWLCDLHIQLWANKINQK